MDDFVFVVKLHFNKEQVNQIMRDVGMESEDQEYDKEQVLDVLQDFNLDEIVENFEYYSEEWDYE